MKKHHIVETHQQEHVLNEKWTMVDARSDFIIRCSTDFYFFTFVSKNLNDEINISTEFVYCIEMSNHVMKLFSSSGSATTLVFEYFHNIRCGKTVFLH